MGKGKSKKKGPPYEDDPGCKYIVIEDPWPGNKYDRHRDAVYWNFLGAWVYFMLGKQERAEVIFSMNTRAEVVVQLPEEVDIVPLLGAHVWRQFLTRGDQKDISRVSYIFEYDYRRKGEPGRHNWSANMPIAEEPPASFPVKFPYPSPHWATRSGRNCADIALPLPQSRERTPTPPPPEPTLFQPYQPPAHLDNARAAEPKARSTAEADGEDANIRVKSKVPISAPLFVDKRDPYEEEDAAFALITQEPSDAIPLAHVKQESTDVRVKEELSETLVRREEPSNSESEPSAAFLAAFERLQRARAEKTPSEPAQQAAETADVSARLGNRDVRSPTRTHQSVERVKPEPEEPSLHLDQSYRGSISEDPRIRHRSRAMSSERTPLPPSSKLPDNSCEIIKTERRDIKQESTDVRVKEESSESLVRREEPSRSASEPSAAFLAAFERLQRARAEKTQQVSETADVPALLRTRDLLSPATASRTEVERVKPEPEEPSLHFDQSYTHSRSGDPRSRHDSRTMSSEGTPLPPSSKWRDNSHQINKTEGRDIQVKPEPCETVLPSHFPDLSDVAGRHRDPQLRQTNLSSMKRPKREDDNGFPKKIKLEPNY